MLGWLVMRSGPRPAAIEHHQVPVDGGSIRVRVYRPVGTGPFPLYVFLHGGGWCVGTIDERDPRRTAVSAGVSCVVVSVDYRMAPENRFPTVVEDCDRHCAGRLSTRRRWVSIPTGWRSAANRPVRTSPRSVH